MLGSNFVFDIATIENAKHAGFGHGEIIMVHTAHVDHI